MKKLTFVIILIFCVTQIAQSQLFKKHYTIAEICNKSSREVELAGEFYITGIIGKRFDVGSLKRCFVIDTYDKDAYLLLASERKTLPGKKDQTITVKCKFHGTTEFWNKRLITLIETE